MHQSNLPQSAGAHPMRRKSAWLAGLASLALTLPAAADWPAGGKDVDHAGSVAWGSPLLRFYDLPSGDLGLIAIGLVGMSYGFWAQRISVGGDIAPGWPGDGVAMPHAFTGDGWEYGTGLDDSACTWFAGPSYVTPTMTRKTGTGFIRPDALLVPAPLYVWPTSTPASEPGTGVVVRAQGGVYVVSNGSGSRIQRLTRSGGVAPGWPAGGVSLGLTAVTPADPIAAISDGAGGAIAFSAVFGPYIQRVDSTAVRHAGWPPLGLPLSSDPADANSDGWMHVTGSLIPSGTDHFIAAWPTPAGQSVKVLKLQRFSADGSVDPAWPAVGVLAVAADTLWGITVISDGLGGAHVLWYTGDNHQRGTHVLANGQFAAGLDATGVPLPAPGSKLRMLPSGYRPLVPYVVGDAAPNGGLVYAWADSTLVPKWTVRVRWLLSDYTANPSEPTEGRLIVPTLGPDEFVGDLCGVHSDGLGGAFVGWIHTTYDPPYHQTNKRIQMTRLLPSSLVGAPPPKPDAPALALSAPRPNPARDAVAFVISLPDDAPARIELLDVAGRVCRTQDVQGAGPRTVVFADLGSLAPGLYFARASSHAGARAMRVALSR
jgi:hypothetical protein